MSIKPDQRFTKHKPCHVCGGHSLSPKGVGLRCFGFISDDGEWAHCTREEFAGGLSRNSNSETYPHRLLGDCGCGNQHDSQPATYKPPGKASSTIAATYGYCDETGEPIGLKRLIARSIATLSIEAQEKHEKNEKVFADL